MFQRKSPQEMRAVRGLRFPWTPLHCGLMQRRLQLAWVVILALTLGDRSVLAQSATNDPAAMVREADASVRRLREICGEAARLEEIAPPEQEVLVDCIHSRVMRIKGLVEVAESAQAEIHKAFKGNATETVERYPGNVKISCELAEKLFLEAQGCSTSVVLKSPPPKAVAVPGTNASAAIKITPRTNEPVLPRRPVERTEQTYLRQERFAVLLTRAMELKLDEKATPDDRLKALAKLAVEPLGGWQPGKCATVDDVYVACARAMRLKVKDPQDPLSYAQALRDEGLGVDTLLPERDPKLDPPYVVDSEVRAFLTTGYAAPLPSSKRVSPD
jgi:hypothetical protein